MDKQSGDIKSDIPKADIINKVAAVSIRGLHGANDVSCDFDGGIGGPRNALLGSCVHSVRTVRKGQEACAVAGLPGSSPSPEYVHFQTAADWWRGDFTSGFHFPVHYAKVLIVSQCSFRPAARSLATMLPRQTCLALWLALDDATLQNGCIWARPGSHKEPLRSYFERVYDQSNQVAILGCTMELQLC